MSDDGQHSDQRTANLARIRDNQRRSRARRKEYLQELEAKYRSCEQSGMEASAEIQAAARKVVEENRKLRQLLKRQGMSDPEIDGFIVDRPENPQYPTAAKALDDMLGQRIPCRHPRQSSECGSDGASTSRSRKPTSIAPAQTPMQQEQQQMPHLAPPYTSPHSNASSSVPTPSAMQFPASQQPQAYAMATTTYQPPIDYGMPWDESIVWQDQYQHQTTQSMGDSSSCYVAADVIRAYSHG